MFKRIICSILCLCLVFCLPIGVCADDPGFSDYPLPEGYSLADITDTSCSLVKEGQVVGGFAITDLDLESLEDWRNWDEENILPPKLIQYLERDLPDTIYDEYMIEGWEPYATVIFVLNNSETDERREYVHNFFEKNGQVWDLWVDRDALGLDEASDVPEEMGIGVSALTYLSYTLPEGYSLTDVEKSTCTIVKDAQTVGGFLVTDLELESLENWEEEDTLPDEIARYLGENFPEIVSNEYQINTRTPYTTVLFRVTDAETDGTKEYCHILFDNRGKVCDLWLDVDILGQTEAESLPQEMEIGTSDAAIY